jgi:predicted transcriptional regulator
LFLVRDRHKNCLITAVLNGFAKDFLNVNIMTSTKLKNFVRMTPVLNPSDNTKRCTRLVVTTGNRALPVVANSKLIGILSETDVILQIDFGNAIVDNVMAGAIVIEDDTALDTALAKMRRYDISRLPIINSKGDLTYQCFRQSQDHGNT